MTAPTTPRSCAPSKLNHLRPGTTYRAVTRHGIAVGEFLGLETSHGDRAILLRHPAGTTSIDLYDLTAIHAVAA